MPTALLQRLRSVRCQRSRAAALSWCVARGRRRRGIAVRENAADGAERALDRPQQPRYGCVLALRWLVLGWGVGLVVGAVFQRGGAPRSRGVGVHAVPRYHLGPRGLGFLAEVVVVRGWHAAVVTRRG
jgi:hypothetical protein